MQKPASQIPQGVGSPPLPGLDPKKGKIMCIKVRLLDNCVAVFHLGHKATGQALFDEVCRHLNLLESDYFGLVFVDGYGNKVFLDKEKSILKQIMSTQSDARFYFVVKFYTPNPGELEEEYTRYLLSLQIRRDVSIHFWVPKSWFSELASGEFVCNENTAALLASFIVQSECGDFSFEDYPDHTYLNATNFIPNQSVAFQIKVMEHHQKLMCKLHQAKDIEGTDVALSVAHMGVKVFHQLNCVSTFSWAKIRKISFKRKRLMIKLHPEAYQYYKDTIEFGFSRRDECKNFWKRCVEHHAFFRCLEVAPSGKESKFFSRGSSFHYCGRTQKQLTDYVREHHKQKKPFERPLRSSTVGRESNQRQIHFNLEEGSTSKPLSYCDGYASVTRSTVPTQRRNGNCQPLTQQQVFYQPEQIRPLRPKSVQHQSINDRSENGQNRPCSSDFESNGKYNGRTSQPPNNMTSAFNGEDPMSLSLPNVLAAEEIKILCHEPSASNSNKMPSKSASGDNFLEQLETIRAEMYDNMSEGSYRLSGHESHRVDSQSDVTTSSVAVESRLFTDTRFTTKRIGNVIVKKVTPSNKTMVRQSNRESSDDDSSSYSDYCRGSSASAPASAINSARVISASKVRAGFAKFRDAIPIPIDYAPETEEQHDFNQQPKVIQIQTEIAKRESPTTNSVNANITLHTITSSATVATPPISTASSTSLATTIIRPKVIPSAVTDVPIRKPIFIKPSDSESSSAGPSKPLITATKPTICSTFDSTPQSSTAVEQSPNSSFRTFVPPTAIKPAAKPISSRSPPADSIKTATYGASGPLPGKIITRENLVLTDRGISAKPAVPPKPKGLLTKDIQPSSSTAPTTSNPVVNEAKQKEEQEKLLAPLESILNDASDLSNFLSQGAQPRVKREPEKRELPAMISVECADQPDVRKLHFLNGEIPYTLTMRNVHQAGQSQTEAQRATVRNRKSLDLVHRNRLPSQDSFSSQDHSISPTTPDSGNIVEYLLRRRSLSGERSLPRKLRTERRLTQPVQLSSRTEVEIPTTKPEADKTEKPADSASKTTSLLLETDF
ncbi:Moesin/ezrin/radixin-like protein 1 [Aphelenchoides bicaudatus]|nr:Moesin/ezrin/radixin-like protein 1 [Aphelenchoides bicaudatus]